MEPFFNRKLIEKAMVTPEQMQKAKDNGKPFSFKGKGVVISGWLFNGCVYINDIRNISKSYRS